MSEQEKPKSFMERLDSWTDQVIIEPLADDGFVAGVEISLQIRRAIREKVLESYKNGLKAGAAKATAQPVKKETSHAQTQAR
jgi:hypothetical protein